MAEGDSEFSASSMLEVTVSDSSLRAARSTIEDELGDISVTVEASGSGQLGSSGSGRVAGRERAMSRQLLDQSNTHLNAATDHLDDNLTLNETRNDILRELLDLQEQTVQQSGGGGRTPRPRNLSGGLSGGVVLAAAALAAGLSSVNWGQKISDALPDLSPDQWATTLGATLPALSASKWATTVGSTLPSLQASDVVDLASLSASVTTVAASSVLSAVAASAVLNPVALSTVVSTVAASALITSVPVSDLVSAVPSSDVLSAVAATAVINPAAASAVLTNVAASEVLSVAPASAVLAVSPAAAILSAVSLAAVVESVPLSALVDDGSSSSQSGDSSGNGLVDTLTDPETIAGGGAAGLIGLSAGIGSGLGSSGALGSLGSSGGFLSATGGSASTASLASGGLLTGGVLGSLYGGSELANIAQGGDGYGPATDFGNSLGQNFMQSNPGTGSTIQEAFTNNPVYGAGQFVGDQLNGDGGGGSQTLDITIDNTTQVDNGSSRQSEQDVDRKIDRAISDFENSLRREFGI